MNIDDKAGEVKPTRIVLETDHGKAVRANPDLQAFAAAADKADYASKLPPEKQPDLVKAMLLKLDELEKRIQALEGRG